MLAKPNKSRGGFSLRENILKFDNSFPIGEEKLSSYSTVVNLTFKVILFTCLSLPSFTLFKHEWENFQSIKKFQFTSLDSCTWQSYLTI